VDPLPFDQVSPCEAPKKPLAGRNGPTRNSSEDIAEEPLVVRVRPDLPAVRRLFDYVVPPAWHQDGRAALVQVGARVRVVLQGRRVAGWVTEVGVEPPEGVALSQLQTMSGFGPDEDVMALAEWVSDEWAAPVTKVLRTASPARNVHRLPTPAVTRRDPSAALPVWATSAFEASGAVVRIPPSGDRWPLIEAAVALGNPLFVVPSLPTVDRLVRRLQSQKITVARMPEHWARARSGAAVVGTRTAVLAPGHQIGSIVVLDEHDDGLSEERAPNWHAREIAFERAARLGVPCVLVSPTPSVEALERLPLIALSRAEEFAGWAPMQIVDRREDPPGRMSLFSSELVSEIRSGRRVGCVLNRRGRARLLACIACGELATCENCEALVSQDDHGLHCERCGTQRPKICASCGGLALKNIRMGVTRAREELAALANQDVSEITASGWEGDPEARLAVGTEAMLHRRQGWDTVAFLDMDQELIALRQNAASQALGLLARASRSVGSRSSGGRVLIQTRMPDHDAVRAAALADPGIVASSETQRRRSMGWPPFGAQAVISGAGAATFIDRLVPRAGIEIRGPLDERWLVRASTRTELAAALRGVERPEARTRVEINPSRF